VSGQQGKTKLAICCGAPAGVLQIVACWLLFFQIRKFFFVNEMWAYIFVKFLSLFKNLGC